MNLLAQNVQLQNFLIAIKLIVRITPNVQNAVMGTGCCWIQKSVLLSAQKNTRKEDEQRNVRRKQEEIKLLREFLGLHTQLLLFLQFLQVSLLFSWELGLGCGSTSMLFSSKVRQCFGQKSKVIMFITSISPRWIPIDSILH